MLYTGWLIFFLYIFSSKIKQIFLLLYFLNNNIHFIFPFLKQNIFHSILIQKKIEICTSNL
jgi:hypothetical protein